MVAVLAMMVPPGLRAQGGANLVANGGYEAVTNGLPDGWSVYNFTGTSEVASDSSVFHEGARSVRLRATALARTSLGQNVYVTGGQWYEFSQWIKTEALSSTDLGTALRVRFANNSGQVGDTILVSGPKGTTDWTRVRKVVQAPSSATKVYVESFIWNATGTVWFDDFQIVSTEPSDFDLPITPRLRAEHPRLLATAGDFAALKTRLATDARLQAWYARLRARAQKILAEPPSTYQKPDVTGLLDISRQVLLRTYTLALLYQLDNDPAYLNRAWQELNAAANFPDWNPDHFLDTAEMTHAFAIGYDWLYQAWTPEQRAAIKTAIVQKGLNQALPTYRGQRIGVPERWGWYNDPGNWNLVINGGIGLGALAIGDEDDVEPLAEEIIRGTFTSLSYGLKVFEPDGGTYEGTGYWDFEIRPLVDYIAGLQTALGTDFGLSDSPGLDRTGNYPIYMTGPSEQSFNFGDAYPTVYYAPHLFWLARRYNQPSYAWWQAQYADRDPHPLDLLWYIPVENGLRASGTPRDILFQGIDLATFRSAWQDRNALYVAMKGMSQLKGGHYNLDAGTFVLDALGVRWAYDLGRDNYNLPGYFDTRPQGGRWTYYRARAEGQNTLVLDPGSGPEHDVSASARVIRYATSPHSAFAITDLTPVYAGKAERVWRGIALLDQRRQVLLQDEVQTAAPTDIWWFMHTQTQVESVSADGKTAVLLSDGQRLHARILSPQPAEFVVMDAQPLPTSPNPAGQDPNNGIRKLAIHLPQTQDLRLAVVFTPLRPWESPPASFPAVEPLDTWTTPATPPALLSGITLDGQPLASFAPDTFTYDLALPSGAAPPVVAASGAGSIEVTQAPAVPGTAVVTVTEDGKAPSRYTINFAIANDLDAAKLPVAAVAASANDGNVPENTLDGNLATRWSADGPGQWIRYDLGQVVDIKSVGIAWFRGNQRTSRFEIQVSNDAVDWTQVFTGTSSGFTSNFEFYNIGDRSARYVRIVGYGNSQNSFNSISEVGIFNRVFETPPRPVYLKEVTVSAPAQQLRIGDTMALSVTGKLSDGTPADLRRATIQFFSDNPQAVRVSADGTVEALADGEVRITAAVLLDHYLKFGSLTVIGVDPQQTRLEPVADTYVNDGGGANTNFGKGSFLLVKSSKDPNSGYSREAYLQFDLSTVTRPVTVAKLYLFAMVKDGAGTEIDNTVFSTGDDWTETGLTWNNRPPRGAALGSFHATSQGSWYAVDVTSEVQAQLAGDRRVSFVIAQTAPYGLWTTINSRESVSYRPYLLLRTPDATAPVVEAMLTPPPSATGWYTQPVTLTLRAHDDPGGTGIRRIEYSATGAQPIATTSVPTATAQILISTDGTTTVSARAVDYAGNASPLITTTVQLDQTAPTISISVPEARDYLQGETIAAQYTCADAGSGVARCEGSLPNGAVIDTTTVGERSFTVAAEDVAGNLAEQTVTYRVIYRFQGFFAPVENPPSLNQVQAGRAVPLKFRLGGDQGLNVLAPGSPRSVAIACDTMAPIAGAEATITAGASELSYDPVSDQYTYVWKTDKQWAGGCRQLVLQLADGTVHRANFRFRD
jgi:hypothetical protein